MKASVDGVRCSRMLVSVLECSLKVEMLSKLA